MVACGVQHSFDLDRLTDTTVCMSANMETAILLGFGLIGDGLNDHLNPRLRKER